MTQAFSGGFSRRQFIRQSVLVGMGFMALRSAAEGAGGAGEGLDTLRADPEGILDLPEGFSYHLFSKTGETMDDGLLVPGKHDGMGVFAGRDGRTILVRNHELEPGSANLSAFGRRRERLKDVRLESLYDGGRGVRPGLGGTTTLVYDTREKRLERHFLSLAGTVRNCAGGMTPWNSWITCEEDTSKPNASGQNPDDPMEREHGYNFEVEAGEEMRLQQAVPLKAMGRFRHEAVAVDPRTGIVYQTEDETDGLFYRFLPNRPGRLAEGGTLQALRIRGMRRADTRNFERTAFEPGRKWEAEWVDLREVESPDNDLRHQGFFEGGAARFARGEGIWYGEGEMYFACTNGGIARKGQIWRYTPSPREGQRGERRRPGVLELFIEPNDGNLVENCDNVTIAPWGDLVICEDGRSPQYLVGVTPKGETYKIGRTTLAEFAGACFSPDGETMFVNIMDPGMTLAVTGPWDEFRGRLKE